MSEFGPDPERVEMLRAVAEEIRQSEDSSEAEQLAAVVHRVSDLYDDAEETSPREIASAMRTILRVSDQGGIDR
jgi:DNA-binding transcriptional ArsR family regulator